MSSDLEAFLKRAAEIRQRKTIEQRAEASQEAQRESHRSARPYSNRKRERMVDSIQAVEAIPEHFDVSSDPYSHEEPIMAVEVVEESKPSKRRGGSASSGGDYSNETIQVMVKLLSSPEGLRQAFLLREILDRPKF